MSSELKKRKNIPKTSSEASSSSESTSRVPPTQSEGTEMRAETNCGETPQSHLLLYALLCVLLLFSAAWRAPSGIWKIEEENFSTIAPYPAIEICFPSKDQSYTSGDLMSYSTNSDNLGKNYEFERERFEWRLMEDHRRNSPSYPYCKVFAAFEKDSDNLYTPVKVRHPLILQGTSNALVMFNGSGTTLTEIQVGKARSVKITHYDGHPEDGKIKVQSEAYDPLDQSSWEITIAWGDGKNLAVKYKKTSENPVNGLIAVLNSQLSAMSFLSGLLFTKMIRSERHRIWVTLVFFFYLISFNTDPTRATAYLDMLERSA